MTTQLSRRPAAMTRTIIRPASARLGRRAAVLIAAVSGLLASVAAVPAFAQPKPMGDGTDTSVTSTPFVITTTGGMPGWQIALIALGAALVAAVIAVVVDRRLAARRHPASAAS